MDSWGVGVLTLFFCLALAALLRKPRRALPPGPPAIPIIGNLMWLTRSAADFESVLGDLWSKYGPVVTIHLGSHPTVMVGDRDLAHKMLVQHGAVFADRPPQSSALRILSSNQFSVNTAGYGPLWRLLRRNLTTEMFNPSRIRQCADAREWVLCVLLDKLRLTAASGDGVVIVKGTFQFAIFCLLVFLCFGEKLEEAAVREIEAAQKDILLFVRKLNIFAIAPKLGRYLFRGRWNRLLQFRQRQREIFLPLIRSRRQQKESKVRGENSFRFCYLDSLLDLEIPDEHGRKLNDEEIISLCSEFLNAGTDTTSTALEWIMANVVKHPTVQEKLAEEVGADIKEEDLQKKPYLKAVVLEGLRRHPPAHLLLPHAVTEEISVRGYTIPKNAIINFAVAKMNLDGEKWQDPLEFRPERFLPGGEGEGVDMTGSKEIWMMPFGVGRRICPGMGLALLHLEYFVANLVGEFRWEAADGDEVDLSAKTEFSVVMRTPLRARISSRRE
ncbi:unnamed protein product [Spirodela intermedia]|uniref:Uncharacterized protein n=1 Tax=Spirodela intermedia TaxID=51605 RepID=A0A7I8LBQ4_SPIIN|nr:unnamed protein product [Spirodela intermedia]